MKTASSGVFIAGDDEYHSYVRKKEEIMDKKMLKKSEEIMNRGNRLFKCDLIADGMRYWYMLTVFRDQKENVVVQGHGEWDYVIREYTVPVETIDLIERIMKDNAEDILNMTHEKLTFTEYEEQHQVFQFYIRDEKGTVREARTATVDYGPYKEDLPHSSKKLVAIVEKILSLLKETGVDLKGFHWVPEEFAS